MTKSYQAPALTDLGTVAETTAFQGSSSRTDYFENSRGEISEAGTGSRDNCLNGTVVTTNPNPSDCT